MDAVAPVAWPPALAPRAFLDGYRALYHPEVATCGLCELYGRALDATSRHANGDLCRETPESNRRLVLILATVTECGAPLPLVAPASRSSRRLQRKQAPRVAPPSVFFAPPPGRMSGAPDGTG